MKETFFSGLISASVPRKGEGEKAAIMYDMYVLLKSTRFTNPVKYLRKVQLA